LAACYRLSALGLRFVLADGRWPSAKGRFYQDDLETPGTSPRSASCRKHNRQMLNLRRYPRGRPQILQRLCCCVENLGFLFALATCDVLAI
jgi:hypothetical protein